MLLLEHLLGRQLSPPCAEQLQWECGVWPGRLLDTTPLPPVAILLCGERNLRILEPLSRLSAAISLGLAFHSFLFDFWEVWEGQGQTLWECCGYSEC